MQTFDFYRFRFFFRAIGPVLFPPGQSSNIVRGALGTILRQVATPETCEFLFGPSTSQADRPRPFVLRCAHLDGSASEPGDSFFLDVHLFELQRALLPHFQAAFAQFAEHGIGPGRGRVELTGLQQLDLFGNPISGVAPSAVPLDADATPSRFVTVRFVTPTELKTAGGVANYPEFGVVLNRLYARIRTLSSLYGHGDVRLAPGLVNQAAGIRLTRSELTWEYASRKSTRTGQTHPLGGFSGEADYEGELAEFLPWLRAARWVGVGRQTVWGKGEMHVMEVGGGNSLRSPATPR